MDIPSTNGPKQRRSVRVLTTIPLLISGRRADGTRFDGTAETIIVNKHGAKIRTQEELVCGVQIRIAIVEPYRFQMARVVSQEAPQEYGIELAQAENFWGVYFPPDDWIVEQDQTSETPADASPVLTNGSQDTVDSQAEVTASVIEEAPSIRCPSTPAPPSPRLSRSGSLAVIRGMAATRTPFQERGILAPISSHQASISVTPLVEPGATVRIILLPEEHVLNAVVVKLSQRRVHGKWQLVLKFETAIHFVEGTEQS